MTFCFVLSIILRTFAFEASRADTRKSGLAHRVLETMVVKAAIKRIQRKHAFFVVRKQARQYNWQVRCGSKINYSLQNIPSYATKHLLHQIRSAIRRYANMAKRIITKIGDIFCVEVDK